MQTSSDEDDKVKMVQNTSLIDNFISEVRNRHCDEFDEEPRPGTSRQDEQPIRERDNRNNASQKKDTFADSRTHHLIREAELGRAWIHETPGNMPYFQFREHSQNNNISHRFKPRTELVHSALVDKTYQLVALHVDEITQEKIVKGEYLDFGRLVPKDRILTAEDN